MKILHLTDTYTDRGGIEQYLLALIGLLEPAGVQNQVVYLREHPQTIRSSAIPARLISGMGSLDRAVDELALFVKREDPDLILLHAIYDAPLIEAAGSLAPTAAYLHGFSPVCPALSKFFRRDDQICSRAFGLRCIEGMLNRRCSEARSPLTIRKLLRDTGAIQRAYKSLAYVMVASTYMFDLLLQNGFLRERLMILPPHFQEIPHFLPPQTQPPVVLFSARLEAEKGLPYLLQALTQTRTSFRLWVAGDGSRRAEYEALASRMGLQDRVDFLGWLDQAGMHAAFQNSSVFVMPSIFPEPFGKVGVEALAHGRPVVAFRVGGIPDWLFDERSGLLVPPLDVAALAAAIDHLIENEQLACELGAYGRQFVQDHFSPQRYREDLLSIFQRVT